MEKIKLLLLGKKNAVFKNDLSKVIYSLNKALIIEECEMTFEKLVQINEEMQNKQYDRLVIIEDYGSLPFMVLAKFHGNIVAQISDEYSSHMTSEHNGSNILVIGSELTGQETIRNIVQQYVATHFAAGRHMVRIDMLNEMV
ncbi:RpiB/LacA/LacB family sugar-phosphate isomerase [Williamsoniiplasma lucivorax]|uniref:Galactose-6-phosphate isomerase n=1 Tax=Williamsoniiplasma lucivorax TaxID=209274 RepID=A0A2S5REI2_9MOLU|nr:RpiB/LacA/LacB family sugar-phosphate isomerase [Williamsoniiplasma lucivorax]PPE05739.1 galactose-6-phosphate isomerase [Williamsoniiplasma lucivorax]